MRSAHTPASMRSERRRRGDRFRERLRISSCCLRSRDSATTERAPPGPANRATVATRWSNRTAKSRTNPILKQNRCGTGNVQEFSDSPCTREYNDLRSFCSSPMVRSSIQNDGDRQIRARTTTRCPRLRWPSGNNVIHSTTQNGFLGCAGFLLPCREGTFYVAPARSEATTALISSTWPRQVF